MTLDLWLAAAAIAFGGLLKGATGAGAPVVAVPVLAMLFDVSFAVVVFVIPNLVTNLWQLWQFRRHTLPRAFTRSFAIGGAVGAAIGSYLLATVAPAALLLAVGLVVLSYILFRLSNPNWSLTYAVAARLVWPVAIAAGALQGATGVSAPISVTFMNAMKLRREVFIATISVFFAVMSLVQIPALMGLGLMDREMFLYSLAALVPLLAFMPVGSFLARHVRRETFDRVILALLAAIAARLIWQALAG